MRTIGLLGGMSWESTAVYYRLANELVRERLGGLHSARLLMLSVDFAEIEELQGSGQWHEAGDLLAAEARRLEAGGADLLVLCTNTMHKVADAIEEAVSIPLLHLGDATADAVRASGITTVGLLGTGFTMSQDFYRARLESHGLSVLVPPADDQALVHRVIYDELCLGVVRDESRAAYLEVIGRLVERGAEGVILGCTEIELLIGPDDLELPSFPTTRIHVEAALDACAGLIGRPVGSPRSLRYGVRGLGGRGERPAPRPRTARRRRLPDPRRTHHDSRRRSAAVRRPHAPGRHPLRPGAALGDLYTAECVGATSLGGTWEMSQASIDRLRPLGWRTPDEGTPRVRQRHPQLRHVRRPRRRPRRCASCSWPACVISAPAPRTSPCRPRSEHDPSPCP